MSSVLVMRRGGLGDTLLLLPVLRALRRARPGVELHFAGVLEFADVLRDRGVVDRVHSSESFATWRLATDEGSTALARLREFALVVTDDPTVAAAARPGTVVRVFDTVSRGDEPFALQLARRLELATEWPDDARLEAPRRATGGPIVLAPGSGGMTKCWPRERWLELANALALRGHAVDVVVGPTEIERDDPRRWSWPVRTTFVADLSVVALAHRLATARVFVGNDSGTTHLAAMLGVPTIVLFGPTDPRVWAPPFPEVVVLRSPTGAVATIASDDVVRALDRSL